MDLGLTKRTAAVAASSKGLGFASAAALAAEGVRVAICGRTPTGVQQAASAWMATSSPRSRRGHQEGAAGFIVEATEAMGRVDILVTNAGGPPPGTFASTRWMAMSDAMQLNLFSVVAMCQEAVPAMRVRGWGRVIAITSMGVRQPIPSLIGSNTARAGATAFLKTLAGEVAPDGVTVNSVQPGSHGTDRITAMFGDDLSGVVGNIPVGRIGDPADFGSIVAFLSSEQAGYITGSPFPSTAEPASAALGVASDETTR